MYKHTYLYRQKTNTFTYEDMYVYMLLLFNDLAIEHRKETPARVPGTECQQESGGPSASKSLGDQV